MECEPMLQAISSLSSISLLPPTALSRRLRLNNLPWELLFDDSKRETGLFRIATNNFHIRLFKDELILYYFIIQTKNQRRLSTMIGKQRIPKVHETEKRSQEIKKLITQVQKNIEDTGERVNTIAEMIRNTPNMDLFGE